MKEAKVIPLFKANDEHIVSNYRPVSISTQFSKVLEKLFEKLLRCFVDKNNLLSKANKFYIADIWINNVQAQHFNNNAYDTYTFSLNQYR